MIEDTLFYAVEPCNSGKRIHILGWIFCDTIHDPNEETYRLSEVKDIYFSVDELMGVDSEDPVSSEKVIRIIFNDKNQKYDAVMGCKKAEECFDRYLKEFSATELDLFACNQDTPIGNYWYDMTYM